MMHLKQLLAIGAALALGSASSAQAPDWPQAERVEIHLANFSFTPDTIPLRHGAPHVLILINDAGGGHDFVAESFFAAAEIRPADRTRIVKGGIRLAGKETAEVHLVAPAAGIYKVRCTHFLHSAFGMKGRIVVS